MRKCSLFLVVFMSYQYGVACGIQFNYDAPTPVRYRIKVDNVAGKHYVAFLIYLTCFHFIAVNQSFYAIYLQFRLPATSSPFFILPDRTSSCLLFALIRKKNTLHWSKGCRRSNINFFIKSDKLQWNLNWILELGPQRSCIIF